MNKIVEYMYFGLPIVCYALTEARVSAADAALYVEANNEDALAAGIVALAGDEQARRRMSEFGVDRVTNALAWDYSEPPLLAAYDKAMALSARGAARGAREPQPAPARLRPPPR